jgi:hypothetical protein
MKLFKLLILSTIILSCEGSTLQWDLDKIDRPPLVKTMNVINVFNTQAMIVGEVINDGGLMVTQRGVCWSTNQNPSTADTTTNNGSGLGTYTSALINLIPNTTYYVKAYAINAQGTGYGEQVSFTTTNFSGSLPTLSTTSVTGVSINGAISGGNIALDGGSIITQRGVCWSTNQSPTTADATTDNGTGLGSFTSTITNLNPNTVYYVRAYASNATGTAYGNEIQFTTQPPNASLVGYNNCSSLDGIISLYYGMNGTSAIWGVSSNGYAGTCFVAPAPNQIGQLGQVIGSNHYLQFDRNFNSEGYIEFWVNTYNAGQNNLIPSIAVNGVLLGNVTMIDGQQSSFYWMKVRSPIIQAGSNTIRILLSGSYYVLKIDELEFYEY